jgi:hypothetical protein
MSTFLLKTTRAKYVMATITIKIDSDELAREVLTHLGYLPGDDIPDLISIDDPDDEEPESAPLVKETRIMEPPVSSRVEFINNQINKALGDVGVTDNIIPEPNDEGFGTPIDYAMENFDVVNSESMNLLNRIKQEDIKRILEKKDKTQKDFRSAAALMKERLRHVEYMQFLDVHKSDPNLNPDVMEVVEELIRKEKAPVETAADVD